jgi:hypothetical protein
MKYIKRYEVTDIDTKKFIDNANKKRDEYKTYIEKYIIFNHMNNLQIGKVIDLDYSTYYFKVDVYDYDNEYKGYNVLPSEFHIITFDVIKAFNTFSEAKDYYDMLTNSNKYNL